MKRLFTLGIAAGAALFASAAAPVDQIPEGYTLRWSDEFNGSALNEDIWNIEINGNGGGNNELQYYRRENVRLGTDPKSGENCLILTARRENFQGRSFTSGRVNSLGKAAFKHGMIQARIKFPRTADGLWPAYWMMGNDMNKYGWPRCGELDIVETGHANGIMNGTQDRYFGGTLHYGPNATAEGHQQFSQDYLAPEDNPIANDEYHIITVEWDDTNISMYYDLENFNAAGKRRARYFTTNVAYSDEEMARGHYFQKPFFFLFNVAVGGSFPGIYEPSQITVLPNPGDETSMYIDWVRVYQKDDDDNALYTYVDADGKVITNIEDDPEPHPGPDDKTLLSGFATKALDDNGVSTFDFSDVSDAVLISTSDGVRGHLLEAGASVTDYNVNNTNRNLYIWENTYVPVNRTGETNSFGWGEGYNKFTVANIGWSGLGFNIENEDLSMVDDSFWLHFAMRATDIAMHTSHEVQVGSAKFRVGADSNTLASVGDFKRDGEWYYFDIPVKALRQFSSSMFGSAPANFTGNVISFLSGGVTDAEICFDNIFFYKSKTKEIPVYTDTDADLGKFGYKSLDEAGAPVFSFDGVTDVVPLVLSGDTWEALTAGGTYGEGSYVKEPTDNSEQGSRNNFFSWDNTISVGSVTDTPNSFGRLPYGGFVSYSAAPGAAWTGAGWASIDGQGRQMKPLDLSTIDDSYVLHLSLRSEDAVGHVPVMIKLGASDFDATLVFGRYAKHAIFADFNRDGEWYSFDIPVPELRKLGALWSNADQKGGLGSYKDYSLCIYTDATLYDNSRFSLDNVFFYTKGETYEIDELGDYGYEALDEEGVSNFDLSGKDYIYYSVNGSVMGQIFNLCGEDAVIGDYRDGVNGSHLYVWEGTYAAGSDSDNRSSLGLTDSFGGDEGWVDVKVNAGWSGLGHICENGADLTELANGEWFLHFSMRGTDNAWHQVSLGDAKFTIGPAPHENIPLLGNYLRDGKWYSFDIPLSKLRMLTTEMFPTTGGSIDNYTGNMVTFMSGGELGNNLQYDNLFLWREHDFGYGDADFMDAEGFEEEDAPIYIYDLSGRLCSDMSAPGLYIIRSGKSVKKVIVR